MISLPSGTRIWLVTGVTDMRKSFNGLGEQIQHVLDEDPFSGHLFIFRGRRGDTVKILWADADGLCLFTKRLEEGHALDLADAAAYMPGMVTISTREARECADVDIAVITVSGGALKPGETRLDELKNTAQIVQKIVPEMMDGGFSGIFLIATNPCDIITWQVYTLSGLPRSQVIGTGV
ncbi:hypothetical protein AOY81_04595 [Escherichia coli]|nr:hypothetical protein AOY81_04595 [Escherichia coli]